MTLRTSSSGVFVLLLCALATPLMGLDPAKSMMQYAHRIWGQEEGLSQPTVYSILQTRDGFIWLGTQDSLIRFDGIHFREFDEGHSVLHGSLVRALAEDPDGNLWVGSLGGGIVEISPRETVKRFSLGQGLPSNSVFCISVTARGVVWACTAEGLVSIEQGKVHLFTTVDGLPSRRIRGACQAVDGTVWVAGIDFGLARRIGSRFASFPIAGLAEDSTVSALHCASDGSVWAGTLSGLAHIAGRKVTWYATRNGLPDDEVSSIAETPKGTLWIGTDDGITRLRDGQSSVYRTRDGLSHSQVLAVSGDREGNLWAGTKNGLDQFSDGKVTPYTTSEGLSSNDVGPVLEDKSGLLWIGTLGHGLNSYDGQRFRLLTKQQGLISDTILSLAADPSGDLWVGARGGINLIRKGKVVATYSSHNGLTGGDVRSLFVDAGNTLWAGTDTGLQHLAGSRFVADRPPSFKSTGSVLALTGDRAIRLFASLDDPGLLVDRLGRLSLLPLETTHAVDCFFLVPEKRMVWMGTLGSGLLRWKEGQITRVYVKDGLYDNRIYSILRDERSNLWLASSKGIFRLNEGELERFASGQLASITSSPFSTGQLHFECRSGVQPAACKTRDGRLWFSTTGGLVVLDPSHLASNTTPPPVKITAMLVDGKRLAASREPHLKPRETNNVEIRYAGLSFVSPEKVTFRYRLQGHDPSWMEAGTRREAFYTNLPPGNFDFVVEARNADGFPSAQNASLRFVVEPRLYQRRWFFPAVASLLGLLTFIGFRLRIRRLKHRFAIVLTERNRIARELHDTLLQGLSGITMQLQALWTRLPASTEKRALGEIIKDAGRCSSEARRSLWGLRSNTAAELGFSERLTALARQSVAGRDVALSLGVEGISLAIFPDLEYQMIRIAQEALTNSLKHSGARHIFVELGCSAGALRMTIDDDGAGFAVPAMPTPGHFGLQGMRERAAEIGAELSVVSSSAGTRVTVSLPLPQNNLPEGNHRSSNIHQYQ